MMSRDIHLTNIQAEFSQNIILVSKTNTNGIITYANRDFCRIAGYTLNELLGKPHNYIRHPNMPRAVFSMMWEMLNSQREFFGYVVNRCANGDHYWVFAQVVPDIAPDTGETISFHSTRRWAAPHAFKRAMDVYQQLLDAESEERSPQAAVAAGRRRLSEILASTGLTYEQWVFSLSNP